MSDSIREQWPTPSAELNEHKAAMWQAIEVVRSGLILPNDDRYETAYASLLTAGGPDGSVSAMGDPGTGKTSFGDMLFGRTNRVELDAKDNMATLYGYRNPIKAEEWIPGKLVGLGDNAYLNEGPHLRNTGPLHPLWDSEWIEMNGEPLRIDDVVIYLTGNFPDGERNHPYDSAFRSRHGMELLTGDHDAATATKIQQRGADTSNKDTSRYPILPDAETRRAISQELDRRYTVGNTGKYIVELVESLNESGLVKPVNFGDARIGRSWHKVARANMLVAASTAIEPTKETRIQPANLAAVASLVLPTLVELSHASKQRMQEATGRRTSKFEEAVALRRIIARTAFTTLYEANAIAAPNEKRAAVENAVARYSYANPDSIKFDIDQALYGGKPVVADHKGSNDGKRSFLRRR